MATLAAAPPFPDRLYGREMICVKGHRVDAEGPCGAASEAATSASGGGGGGISIR